MDAQNPLGENTCGSLLNKLQEIWDEVGESDEERDKMLLQIDQECLDVYKRKVEQAANSRAQLRQSLSDAKLELFSLLSALGEKSFAGIPEKTSGTIKEQLAAIAPILEQLWKQKEERIKVFSDVQSQIQNICGEIAGDFSSNDQTGTYAVDESDLTLEKLDKYQSQLQDLQKEKSERLHKLQELASQLIDLWNLMDTPLVERRLFDHVTCNMSTSVDEVTAPGALALDLIEQAEVEVERLDNLKASRMKEIAFKKQAELEEIFAHAHLEIDSEAAREKIMSMIDSGNIEPTELLADMDNQIAKAKEEALGRKDILDKVEKWMSACEEESWLEDYNRDENRYNASRGAHLNLKRAEKARILVNKIPALVDTLVAKTHAWEEAHDISFTYDAVPLLAMLDEYAVLRHEREEEKRRMREHKKYQEQQNTEPEPVFGSRSSPARPIGNKKVAGPRANGGANGTPNRRLSLNAHQNGSRSSVKDGKRDNNTRQSAPLNYASSSKEDAASHVSGTEPVPTSP
ncbi:PREDICTED: 65-kDa microtubule-associated protein 1-like isoform X2 [Lupinus angustifolius]|uniref:65-kDa microtubule-associated protein 1-like isoform X2 n=1 Tax=Lupinus angustifolius TaxID=3871 RepID=UPI00092EBB27|nr:PREDICTED: 65-kDa microtubule-associated protein 1-like isoform X2 [Lupinus angustifolius]